MGKIPLAPRHKPGMRFLPLVQKWPVRPSFAFTLHGTATDQYVECPIQKDEQTGVDLAEQLLVLRQIHSRSTQRNHRARPRKTFPHDACFFSAERLFSQFTKQSRGWTRVDHFHLPVDVEETPPEPLGK